MCHREIHQCYQCARQRTPARPRSRQHTGNTRAAFALAAVAAAGALAGAPSPRRGIGPRPAEGRTRRSDRLAAPSRPAAWGGVAPARRFADLDATSRALCSMRSRGRAARLARARRTPQDQSQVIRLDGTRYRASAGGGNSHRSRKILISQTIQPRSSLFPLKWCLPPRPFQMENVPPW